MTDPASRLPAPPVDMVVSPYDAAVAQGVFIIACSLVLLFLVYALRDWQRSKSPILLLILFGGAVTNIMEPFVDITGGCWQPIVHQDTTFSIMGRPMPLWLLPTYAVYFGGLTMCMFVAFRKGISSRAMWLWFIVPVIADILLEEGLLGVSGGELYNYYGNQPLRLDIFPIWWAPVNAAGVFLPAWTLALAAPHLRGWRLALVPLATPLLYCGAGSLTGYPSDVVINSDFPYWVTQLGGVASFMLAGGLVYVCVVLFAADSRWQIRDALTPSVITGSPITAGYRWRRGDAGNRPPAGVGAE